MPSRLKSKITYIARRTCEARVVYAFDQQYTYVAHLVDKYTRHEHERSAVSLDDEVSVKDSRRLYAFCAQGDNGHDRHKPYDADATEQALTLLQRRLRQPQVNFVSRLLQNANGSFQINPYAVAAELGTIRRRMNELSERYERNGEIHFPDRPLKEITFEPLSVRFGRRRFGSSPLKYYLENRDRYADMGRTELFEFDQSLYNALLHAGQLDEAIADGRRRIVWQPRNGRVF